MSGLILMYHRVAEVASDPWGLSVSPRRFEEHLDVLARRARPTSLEILARDLAAGALSPRSVAVTFDDGYADNLHEAAPRLERRGIPATVFVTTGPLADARPFWWDELEILLLSTRSLPPELQVSLRGRVHHWTLETGPGRVAASLDRGWRVSAVPPSRRHEIYLALWQLLQPIPAVEQQQVLEKLREWAVPHPADRPPPPTLTAAELVRLAGSELIDIGAHTVTHPVLAGLPEAAQRGEIEGSKSHLESLLDGRIRSFSYPYGAAVNYTPATVSLVRAAGFDRACCTLPTAVRPPADPFALPRVQVEDWDGEEFGRRLDRWLDD